VSYSPRWAPGGPAAARSFVGRFERTVFGVALATLGDLALAEEIAQQAFLHARRHASLYHPRRDSVRSWLIATVHNLAVDAARIRRPTPVDPHELTDLIAALTPSPEHSLLAGESALDLAATLRALPPEQARAAVMVAVFGYTARDIAAVEEIPLGTAKTLRLPKTPSTLVSVGARARLAAVAQPGASP